MSYKKLGLWILLMNSLSSLSYAQTVILPSCDTCSNNAFTLSCEADGLIEHAADTSTELLHGLYINKDGKLVVYGQNTGGYGRLGTFFIEATATTANLPFNSVENFLTHTLAPNINHFLPNEVFVDIEANWLDGVVFLLSDEGKLYSYNDRTTGTTFGADTGRPENTPKTAASAMTPYNIEAPNGKPWESIITSDRNSYSYALACAGDTWYVWGNGGREAPFFQKPHPASSPITLYEPQPAITLNSLPLNERPRCNSKDEEYDTQFNIGGFGWIDQDGVPRVSANSFAGVAPLNAAEIILPAGVTAQAIEFGPDSFYMALVLGSDGKTYYVGTGGGPRTDIPFPGNTGLTAIPLNQPAGVEFKKITVGNNNNIGHVVALDTDGYLWLWVADRAMERVDTTNSNMNSDGNIADIWVDGKSNVYMLMNDGSAWGYNATDKINVDTTGSSPRATLEIFLAYKLNGAESGDAGPFRACNGGNVGDV